MKRLITSTAATLGLMAACTPPPVHVAPPPPEVVLADACWRPGSFAVQYTFMVVGNPLLPGGFMWLHTTGGNSPADFHNFGDIWTALGLGPGEVLYAPDLDDNGINGLVLLKVGQTAPTKRCAP